MTSDEVVEEAGPEGGAPSNIEHIGVLDRELVDEMRTSYLNYSMSVIVGRALPDARDGLKPVHRRILHSMNEGGMVHGKPYKKSGRVVGDVLGKYHPHGDLAIYDSLVRMAQPFSLRYMLIDGQGNFGSIDGDGAAAMRYTECRMSRLAMEMMEDIDKGTVDMVPNYDGTLEEPRVLPSRLPNLLLNGSSGIAVGMATNIPPHNLSEVVDGLKALINDPELEVFDLMEHIKAPDFPTGGIIYGRNGVYDAYSTGRGKLTIRARCNIENQGGDDRIVVTEIPYMVNKSTMLQKIAELVKAKVFEGISDIRDESDKDGLRVVIELKRDTIPEVVLNQLYTHSDLQVTFGVINLALVDNQPRVLSLKDLLSVFLDHRRVVTRRRVEFDLRKARERLHIVDGLIIALDHLDDVIAVIRSSKSPQDAQSALMEGFTLSELQSKAILDLKLQKLTSLERDATRQEGEELKVTIADYEDILGKPQRIDQIIQDELTDIKERYGDQRRTMIEENAQEIDLEDLIEKRDVVITITNTGYLKRQDLSTYRLQNRGGKGLRGLGMKEEDFVVDMFVCSSHDTILFFTSSGKVFWLKAYGIPPGSRQSKGKPVINILPHLEEGERVLSTIPISDYSVDRCLVFATKRGIVKKTTLAAYSRPRSTGIIAINLEDGDELVSTQLANTDSEAVLATAMGKANRFKVSDIRTVGRNAKGVRGMRLKYASDDVVSLAVLPPSEDTESEDELEDSIPSSDEELLEEEHEGPKLLTITENGYGKRAYALNYRLTRRGGSGVINIRKEALEETGRVVGLLLDQPGSEMLLATQSGMVIRTVSSCIRLVNRVGKGVRVIRLDEGDRVVAVAMVKGLGTNGEGEVCDTSENEGEDGALQVPGKKSITS
ncbi:MAG: DNA gyrase subunit A [Candidatus Thermoplasmatota archaeon]|nr:DNA gyrase subunit A [Candidatus Thermoplasmatota archaeon]